MLVVVLPQTSRPSLIKRCACHECVFSIGFFGLQSVNIVRNVIYGGCEQIIWIDRNGRHVTRILWLFIDEFYDQSDPNSGSLEWNRSHRNGHPGYK